MAVAPIQPWPVMRFIQNLMKKFSQGWGWLSIQAIYYIFCLLYCKSQPKVWICTIAHGFALMLLKNMHLCHSPIHPNSLVMLNGVFGCVCVSSWCPILELWLHWWSFALVQPWVKQEAGPPFRSRLVVRFLKNQWEHFNEAEIREIGDRLSYHLQICFKVQDYQ